MHDPLDKELKKYIEDFAAQVVITEVGDIPALGEMLKILGMFLKSDNQYIKTVAEALNDYVERLILEEKNDISILEEGAEVFQHIEKSITTNGNIDMAYVEKFLEKSGSEIDLESSDFSKEPEKKKYVSAAEDMQLYFEFAQESIDNLESAEVDLIDLEENPGNQGLINSVFRAFHTIKGVSGFLELVHINKLAHKTETLLDNIRQGLIAPTSDVTDIVLSSIDLMKKMIFDIQEGIETSGTIPSKEWVIDDFLEKLEYTISPPSAEPIGTMLVSTGKVSSQDLNECLKAQQNQPSKKLGELLVENNKTSSKDVAQALRKQKSIKKNSYQVKVDTEKLDALVDLTGELVIAQSILKEFARVSDGLDNRFVQSMGHMNQIVSSVQKISMSMRMVPIGNTFQKMIRVVRDVSANLGKKVELCMEGKETEVDRNMVDALYEPLVHMVRNSVDHGIEFPEDRTAAGKSDTGTITLASYHKAGNIVIEIIDDGKGLNKEVILSKAISKGLVTANEKLSEKDIFNLIFHPGFSTTENVTDVSGRGVGMDVVKEAIENLKGHLDITSEEGAGTRFTIRLPLTMAIIDGMLVRTGSERYIVPTMSILEAVPFDVNTYFTVEKKGEMIRARGEMIRLVRLEDVCSVSPDENNDNRLVLIVENKGSRCGLLLDELLGKDEFVIKNLGDLFKESKVFSGGAILGDGRVGLIIDMSGLFEWAQI